MTIRKTLKYRLYRHRRTRNHVRDIERTSEVWNYFVRYRRLHYKLYGHLEGYRSPSAYTLANRLTKLKRRAPYAHWRTVDSQVLKNVIARLDDAYNVFFVNHKAGRKARPPGFRSRYKYRSITYSHQNWRFLGQNRIRIAGHNYKFVDGWDGQYQTRPHGKHNQKHHFAYVNETTYHVKTMTVKRDRCGDLWLCLSVICETFQPTLPRTGQIAGVDFGLKMFLTIWDGELKSEIQSPLPLKSRLNDLRRAHRNLSSKQRGSNSRRKAVRRLQKVYRRVTDARRDFHFKTARTLLERYDVVALEDLSLKGMKRLWGRKVSDLGFYGFCQILEALAEREGKTVVYIPRYYPSSKTCSSCGAVNDALTLQDRRWRCPSCGVAHDRDLNAAKNIREKALSLREAA